MNAARSLMPLLEKLNAVRILCVGDVMLDQFVYGQVERISPEAPVPVLSVKRRTLSAGGAGNVVSNLSGLGCTVTLVGVVGDDAAHATLKDVMKDIPGLSAALVVDKTRPTIRKDRFVGGAQQMLRVDDEQTGPLSSDIEDALVAAIKTAARDCNAVIVSDYGKGVVTKKILNAVFALGLPVCIDPKGNDYTRYKGARLVTPNRKELAEATNNMPVTSDADVAAAALHLIKTCGIQGVLATRSADGMTIVDGKGDPVHLRTQAREVFDVSGAGDTVIATAAAVLAAGSDLMSAAALANIAGGIVVEKVGTAAIRTEDLKHFLMEEGHRIDLMQEAKAGCTIAPVLDWKAAREQVERWHARGLKIGFTNGCFDLVHQGHVTMLDRCRAVCDKLVLGLNCDASVSRLKGPTRPVNNQDARARVIAALGSVDAVVLFGDKESEKDTPLDLIKALRPDCLFKGADYTAATVVGSDFVESLGGQVILIPLEEGFSTTNTIKKMGAA